jgi:futalosine hydrolase
VLNQYILSLIMSFKILFVTSTSTEADVLEKLAGFRRWHEGYRSGDIEILPLIAGVGSMSTAWAMKQWIVHNERPGLAINAGIAGSFNPDFRKGAVVMPVTDCFADSGIEDGDNFVTLSEAGLTDANEFPFRNGLLHADSFYAEKLKDLVQPVSAVTVNTASGSVTTIDKLVRKFNPDIETMEGATFFYICARESIPFLAVRAVSNMVEPRNRSSWNIALALDNLSVRLNEIILTFR